MNTSKDQVLKEINDLEEHYQLINNKINLEKTKLFLLEKLDEVLKDQEISYNFFDQNDIKNIENELIKKLQI